MLALIRLAGQDCMDHSHQHPTARQRQRPVSTRSGTSAYQPNLRQQPSSQDAGSMPYMRTAPPPQWQDTPSLYRPRDFEQYQPSTVPESLFLGHPHLRGVQNTQRTVQRQPRAPESIPVREEHGRGSAMMDPSLLYPSIAPNFNTRSAPEDEQRARRVVSQPGSPYFVRVSPEQEEPPSMAMLPRSPTYPPASRRRIRSANSFPEVTFADPEEFHLFAEATAGLEPEPVLRPFSSLSFDSSEHRNISAFQQQSSRPSDAEQHISPLQETPTTVYALQQLAQMPQGNDALQHRHFGPFPHSVSQGDGSTAVVGANSWLYPPDDPYDEEGFSIDDELPDYAMSQAQAHAAQRAEATRRAQELHRRWQQSR